MIYQKPKRTFEKSGSVNPESSYYVPLENVVNSDKQDIKTMVDMGRYFSIFAPRQSGKTTFLKRFCGQLHADPTYVAIILCFEDYKNLDKTDFYSEIETDLYDQLIDRLREVRCEKTEAVEQFCENHRLTNHISFRRLFEKLNRIIQLKKIVIFIDEFDGIPLKELENFLTSLRKLYIKYKDVKQKALYSIGLVGIRNITKLIVGGVSPFNIADQVDLPFFSLKMVRDLYAQYTTETNQPFKAEAVKKIHEETGGQPWLVNRLGTILTVDIKPGTIDPIDERDVEKAIQMLLAEKNDHFDNLYEKAKLYKETFVEIVFDNVEYSPYHKDQTWLEQYGLVKNKNSRAIVANNIYKTIFIKIFFSEVKAGEKISAQEYILPGNKLDMERILLDFDQYIARIGVRAFYQKVKVSSTDPFVGSGKNKILPGMSKEMKPYEKTGQFLLTAWLYQFVKEGAGDLRYEVPSGLGRMDIMLNYKGRRYIIETKVNHQDDITHILREGISQVAKKYLATESAHEGYLVIFDTKTHAGAVCKPREHREEDKKVTSFIIGIGYREK
ncbi:MAG: ATP-binding protein [Candidatus Aminicenantes bacterium]|nr:MAG: ATP-binding protein [Candidatus Aminicenantes bacterium]